MALLRGWLDGQRHTLGVLKVLGASRSALVVSSLVPVACLTGLAALAGVLLGLGLGEALARVSAGLLNLDLLHAWVSPAALAFGLGLGLLLPWVFTAVLIGRWSGQHPARALAERELQRPDPLSRLRLPGPLALRLAVRNVLRRRQRFGLSCLLLAVAGAVFMGGLNLRAAWGHLLNLSAAQRLYQIELRLAAPIGRADLTPLLQVTPKVSVAEGWDAQSAAWVNAQGLAVSHAYPDGGHGQLQLRLAPQDETLQRKTLSEGRWLTGAADLVINQAAAALLDRPAKLGDALSFAVGDKRVTATLVGRVDEPMSPPTVYRLAAPYAPSTRWRLGLEPGADPQAVAAHLVANAADQGLPGLRTVTERDLRQSTAGHLLVLQRALLWVALGTGLVGVVALASALGSSVAERRRELAVLHALGAPRGLLARSVMAEALIVVLVSLVLALALGGGLDALLATRLGEVSGQPLRAHADGWALPVWALLALVAGVLASAGAARRSVHRMGR
jgi:putative ABC transport system permease protein